ncbi:MAG: hypothetical protein MJ010_01920 [Paludibacteraceae bacterium]|nr:hypothetical protein [Paludibacteraceae bacterium]
MNKKMQLALAILSIIGLAASIYVCTIEKEVSDYVLGAIFFIAAVFFINSYRRNKG